MLSNILILHRTANQPFPISWPKVSILIPARNEEANITNCLRSLLAQDYPDFELLVLDDQSTDRTLAILQQFGQRSPRLTVLAGKPLPAGWVGKNWACAQLAQAASGGLLFFTDADTVFQPAAVRNIVMALIGEQADLVTGYPRQVLDSWGERLLVPFFSWATLCFYPLGFAYQLRWPFLTHAVGQMMCFRRETYFAIGGHLAIKDIVLDDFLLARKIQAAGLRWRVLPVSNFIYCRMYAGGRDAFTGFSKNLFAVFHHRLVPFTFAYVWMEMMFLEPWVVFALWLSGNASAALGLELAACIGLSVLLWVIPFIELKISPGLAFLYPFIMLLIGLAAFQSARLTIIKGLIWKDRSVPPVRWKWL